MNTVSNLLTPIHTYEGLHSTRVTYIVDHSSGKKLILDLPEYAGGSWKVEQGRDEFFNPIVIESCDQRDEDALAAMLAKHFPR